MVGVSPASLKLHQDWDQDFGPAGEWQSEEMGPAEAA